MNKEAIKEKLLEKAKEGRISCPEAFKLAEEFNCTNREIGEICNDNKIKIHNCQLGCF